MLFAHFLGIEPGLLTRRKLPRLRLRLTSKYSRTQSKFPGNRHTVTEGDGLRDEIGEGERGVPAESTTPV
jgi:hypothetical protein